MKKIATIVGARPQFVKSAVVSRAIRKLGGLEEIIIHTGQHFDSNMSEVFFKEMEIPEPDINLGIHSKSEAAMTGEMIIALEKAFTEIKPEMVVVYGDTTSTLAAAIAAMKCGIYLSHVEAGLRSYNRLMPEETNRLLTDHSSDLLLCPTNIAVSNLLKEGVNPEKQKIVLSGDVMFDAFKYYKEKLTEEKSNNVEKIIKKGNFVLLTLHRQSNVDDPEVLSGLISAVGNLSREVRVVFPVHPRTRKKIQGSSMPDGIELIDPVGYLDMINLLMRCEMVLTDSGGLQKEAYFAGKYCITLRNETEWVELVEGGYNILAGDRLDQLEMIYNDLASRNWSPGLHLYGEGNASDIIAGEISKFHR